MAAGLVFDQAGAMAGDPLEAQSVPALGQAFDHALAVAILVELLPSVSVGTGKGLPLRQHEIDQPCQLVGRGRDGLGSVDARAQP